MGGRICGFQHSQRHSRLFGGAKNLLFWVYPSSFPNSPLAPLGSLLILVFLFVVFFFFFPENPRCFFLLREFPAGKFGISSKSKYFHPVLSVEIFGKRQQPRIWGEFPTSSQRRIPSFFHVLPLKTLELSSAFPGFWQEENKEVLKFQAWSELGIFQHLEFLGSSGL